MAHFEYRGRTAQGDLVSGRVEGESVDSVATQLFNTGVTPIDISEAPERKPANQSLAKLFATGYPTQDELVLFTRQMYSLTRAGVPIIRGLQGLMESTRNERLREALDDIIDNLEAGRELSVGLARHPRIFNALYVSIVRVGEETGRLEESFNRLYQYLDLEKETRKQIKSALRYPAIVVAAITVAMFIVTTWVIPKFAEIFTRFDLDLPIYTVIILGVANFMQAWWPVLLVATLAAIVGFIFWKRTPQGRYRWDRAKLKFPVVGQIILRGTLARFSRAFGMAYRSGVPLIQAMTLCSRAVDNAFIAERIVDMRNGVERGEAVSRTAAATGVFTPLVLQMMSVGEETGALDDMLDEAADFYEREVAYDVKNLASLIEPVITIMIGVMVLILALGVFLPMWDLVQIAQQR